MKKLSTIKLNPKNPRLIKDAKFKKLCESIKKDSKFLELRPIIIDKDNIILGGNMRFRALKELGYKEVPNNWIKKATDLTKAERERFIVRDNIEFGEFDFDMLANDYEKDFLLDVGFEEWELGIDNNPKEKEIDENIETENECPKCHYKW